MGASRWETFWSAIDSPPDRKGAFASRALAVDCLTTVVDFRSITFGQPGDHMRIAILGAGDIGTAMSVPAAANHHEVRLWGSPFDQAIIAAFQAGEVHPRLGVRLPENVCPFPDADLATAIADADLVVLAVTASAIVPMLARTGGLRPAKAVLVSMAKGLIETEDQAIRLISDVVRERIAQPFVCTGGPCKANEIALGLPTAMVFGSRHPETKAVVEEAFGRPNFNVHHTASVESVEIGAALKNAYAIAVGVATGMEHRTGTTHQNLKSAIFPVAIREMALLAQVYGGDSETMYGLAGVGDLLVTITGGRNRLLGEMIGEGQPVAEALSTLQATGMTIEGHAVVEMGYRLCRQLEREGRTKMSEFPLLTALYYVLYQEAPLFETLWAALKNHGGDSFTFVV